MGSMSDGFDDIAKAIAGRKNKRDVETVRDSIIVEMKEKGAKPESLDILSKISAETPDKLIAAMKDIQTILSTTPAGQEEEIARKVKESTAIAEGRAQAQKKAKLELIEEKKAQSAEKSATGTLRFMQQFNRSYEELKSFDSSVDEQGVGGWMTRNVAKLKEKIDDLPETSALRIQILPMANEMAREIEGGKITDQDRKIYADSFASALQHPIKANIRLMSNSIISLLDKGGNESGAITRQLKELASTKSDIFNSVITQVITEYPELVKEIFGEDAEVVQ